MKRLIYVLILGTVSTIMLVLFTSCSTYTCPTYSGTIPKKDKYNVGVATMTKISNKYAKTR